MIQRPGRRNACPSLSRPMSTGDGWLVRLAPLRHPLEGAALITLATAAQQFGNGELEVTQRGNLQARGFTQQSAADFATRVAGCCPQPPASPAVSLEPRPTRTSVAEDGLERLYDSLMVQVADLDVSLPPKCTLVLERDGRWGMADLVADVRLRLASGTCALGLGGNAATAYWLRWAAVELSDTAGAPERDTVVGESSEHARIALLAAARTTLHWLGQHPGLRGAALYRDAAFIRLLKASGWQPASSPRSARAPTPGAMDADRLVLGIPFGTLDAAGLKALGECCQRHHAVAWWLPGRKLLLHGRRAALAQLYQVACANGLIVEGDDPRLRISACRGAPGCAAGNIPARQLAAAISARLGSGTAAAGRQPFIHVSGCAKGCAAPNSKALCMVGHDDGRVGIVEHGLAHDRPDRYISLPGKDDGAALIDIIQTH